MFIYTAGVVPLFASLLTGLQVDWQGAATHHPAASGAALPERPATAAGLLPQTFDAGQAASDPPAGASLPGRRPAVPGRGETQPGGLEAPSRKAGSADGRGAPLARATEGGADKVSKGGTCPSEPRAPPGGSGSVPPWPSPPLGGVKVAPKEAPRAGPEGRKPGPQAPKPAQEAPAPGHSPGGSWGPFGNPTVTHAQTEEGPEDSSGRKAQSASPDSLLGPSPGRGGRGGSAGERQDDG